MIKNVLFLESPNYKKKSNILNYLLRIKYCITYPSMRLHHGFLVLKKESPTLENAFETMFPNERLSFKSDALLFKYNKSISFFSFRILRSVSIS